MKDSVLKVTLVNPPFQYFPGMRATSETYSRPPLGIAYLAAYLQKNMPEAVRVNLIDCAAERLFDVEHVTKAISIRKIRRNIRAWWVLVASRHSAMGLDLPKTLTT